MRTDVEELGYIMYTVRRGRSAGPVTVQSAAGFDVCAAKRPEVEKKENLCERLHQTLCKQEL